DTHLSKLVPDPAENVSINGRVS
ncbi:uncharacterized protein METZ01_LOCUS864, partial [marine metagenome]